MVSLASPTMMGLAGLVVVGIVLVVVFLQQRSKSKPSNRTVAAASDLSKTTPSTATAGPATAQTAPPPATKAKSNEVKNVAHSMINLLPPEVKLGYSYARRNVMLRRWLVALVLVFAGLAGIGTFGLITLHQSTNHYNNLVTVEQTQLQNEDLNQTEAKIQDISNSLKLAVKVLSSEVLFSKLIQQIGSVMPNGTVLTGLSTNQVSGGLELSAYSTNYTAATQIQVNLTDPSNQVFSTADIESISCGGNGTTPQQQNGYLCSVKLRALFSNNNPYLFINQGNKK